MMIRDQVLIDSAGNMISISIPAVKVVMDLYEIKDQKDCLTKVLCLFDNYRTFIKEKEEGSREGD